MDQVTNNEQNTQTTSEVIQKSNSSPDIQNKPRHPTSNDDSMLLAGGLITPHPILPSPKTPRIHRERPANNNNSHPRPRSKAMCTVLQI